MADLKKKNILGIILCGAGMMVVAVFIITVLFVFTGNNPQKDNTLAPDQSSEIDNVLKLYVVSGMITDIRDKTIILETPVFDPVKKGWSTDKKEIRKLTITDRTKFFRNRYEWDKEEKESEGVSEPIKFEDIKVGDRVSANYSDNLITLKDFSPEMLTVLSN